jgi:hypothetical protein
MTSVGTLFLCHACVSVVVVVVVMMMMMTV